MSAILKLIAIPCLGLILLGFALGRLSVSIAPPTRGYADVTNGFRPPYRLCYADGKQWATMLGDACREPVATK